MNNRQIEAFLKNALSESWVMVDDGDYDRRPATFGTDGAALAAQIRTLLRVLEVE